MAYRNKTYVCFDGDTDIKYYNLMKAWKQNDNTDFNFYDAHDLNTAYDSSKEESIKRQLRERLLNTKIFVILLGEHTKYLTKFVKWEMEQAMSLNLPIIVVNLNKSKKVDNDRYPKNTLGDYLTINIPYNSKIMQYALENWESQFNIHKHKKDTGAYIYKDEVYEELGIVEIYS